MSSFEQILEDIHDRHEEAALAKLETYREDINQHGEDGWTLLYWSVTPVYKVAQKLLTMGADPNIKTLNGWTALHRVVAWNDLKAVELLVEAGADSSIETDEGDTALDLAIRYNHTKIVEYLAEEIPLTKRAQ